MPKSGVQLTSWLQNGYDTSTGCTGTPARKAPFWNAISVFWFTVVPAQEMRHRARRSTAASHVCTQAQRGGGGAGAGYNTTPHHPPSGKMRMGGCRLTEVAFS